MGGIVTSLTVWRNQANGDRVTVMRDGKLLAQKCLCISLNEVIEMMIGREIANLFPRHHTQPGSSAESKGLCSGKG